MPQQSLDLRLADPTADGRTVLAPGACVLHGFAVELAPRLLSELDAVSGQAAFRHLTTPGGLTMSVAMTNCGRLGWVSDRRGYRYQDDDPLSGKRWPDMPRSFIELACAAASACDYENFDPDACLVNRYAPGTRLSLHRDADERRFDVPIVSVSLGLPAVFLFGGEARTDRTQRVPLQHGDVVVWGGPARLRYHGVQPIKDGWHALTGACRFNLTFRMAG